ncbi:hypothetical protein GCM10009128_12010 [Psychrosphaera haliotis]
MAAVFFAEFSAELAAALKTSETDNMTERLIKFTSTPRLLSSFLIKLVKRFVKQNLINCNLYFMFRK